MISYQTFIFTMLILGAILLYAMLFLRQQRRLSEKKAALLLARKEFEIFTHREETLVKDLNRVTTEYNKKFWDTNMARLELKEHRHVVRDEIEIIRKETREASDNSNALEKRITDRRKEKLRELLERYRSLKHECIVKFKETEVIKSSVNLMSEEKSKNREKHYELENRINLYQAEFDRISGHPIIPFPALSKRKKS